MVIPFLLEMGNDPENTTVKLLPVLVNILSSQMRLSRAWLAMYKHTSSSVKPAFVE